MPDNVNSLDGAGRMIDEILALKNMGQLRKEVIAELKRLNDTIDKLKKEVQAAHLDQFERGCKVICAYCYSPYVTGPAYKIGSGWGHKGKGGVEGKFYKCAAVALRRAREERTP